MQRRVLVLLGVIAVLGCLLATQVARDGLVLWQSASFPTSSAQMAPPESVSSNSQLDGSPIVNVTSTSALDAQSAALNRVFNNADNSVVQITSKIKSVNPNIIINGNPFEQDSTRLGSGFIYDKEGRIVTNNHVVDGAETVDVTFIDGNIYSAKVVGRDPFSDIAVLQITDDFAAEEIVPLELANSSNLQVGQQVVAIGNPFGLSDTMTTGIVSQVGRLLPNKEMSFSIPNAIQTDAAINPGNSGGPLLDLQGHVIGVNTAIQSRTGDFAGIGFAIPSNTVARIAPHLISEAKYDHPWLGITGASLSPDLAVQMGLPKTFKGVAILEVSTGSPAEKAGVVGSAKDNIPDGDILTDIDSHPVKRIEDVIVYVDEHTSVGSHVALTLYKDGQSHNVIATLQARPSTIQDG